MSRTDKFMPVYIADYLGDTSHLGMAEHGAYLLLLFHYWRTQQALPDDEQQLQRITRGSKAEWKAVAPTVRAFFKETTINGVRVLVHSRVEREMAEAKKRSEAKRNASRIANGVRWASQTDNSGTDLESRTAPPSPSPSPSHSANAEKSISATSRANPARSKNLLNGNLKDFEEFWRAYPKRVKRGAAEKAYLKALQLADAATILVGAKRYAEIRKGEDDQYTSHATTWLNGKCWLDEFPSGESANTVDPEFAAALAAEAEHRRKHGEIE